MIKVLRIALILPIVISSGCDGSGTNPQTRFPTEQLFIGNVVQTIPLPETPIVSREVPGPAAIRRLPDINGDGLADLLSLDRIQ